MTLSIKRVKTDDGVGFALVSGNARVSDPMSWIEAVREWESRRSNPCRNQD